METRRFDKKDVKEVAELLKNGQVVAFPTDTVFGLGVIYENEEALRKLKESKGRPENKPIPTMVADVEQMKCIAQMPAEAVALADAFMPGAFTMILKKQDEQVLKQLDGRIDAIVLGEAKGKLASTIVDMSEEEPRIVREGPISADDIKKVLHNA